MCPARVLALAAAAALLVLVPASEAAQPLGERDIERYRAAFDAAHDGRWSEAEAHAGKTDDPVLRNVLHWLALQDADYGADHAAIARFLDRHPPWPSRDALRERAEDAMPENVPARDVVAFFDAFPPLTATGAGRHVAALIETGRGGDARDEVARAWTRIAFDAAEERSFLDRFGDMLSGEQRRERIDRLIWDGRLDEARRILFLLGDDERKLAHARILLRGGDYGVDAAIAAVPEHLADDPGLLHERVRWRLDRDMDEGALALLRGIPSRIPYPDRWAVLRLRLAWHLLDEGDHAGAYAMAAGHMAFNGEFHHRAEWLAGWTALRLLDRPDAALEHFSGFFGRVATPISRARGAYWAGRAADAKGEGDLALGWYARAAQHGHTWYGQLAALRLGVAPKLSAAPPVSAEDADSFAGDALVNVTRRLHEIGERELVEVFLLDMASRTLAPARFRLLGEMALDMGRPELAVRVAKRAARAGTILIDAEHPVIDLPHGDVEPGLVLALIGQESAFDAGAVSGPARPWPDAAAARHRQGGRAQARREDVAGQAPVGSAAQHAPRHSLSPGVDRETRRILRSGPGVLQWRPDERSQVAEKNPPRSVAGRGHRRLDRADPVPRDPQLCPEGHGIDACIPHAQVSRRDRSRVRHAPDLFRPLLTEHGNNGTRGGFRAPGSPP